MARITDGLVQTHVPGGMPCSRFPKVCVCTSLLNPRTCGPSRRFTWYRSATSASQAAHIDALAIWSSLASQCAHSWATSAAEPAASAGMKETEEGAKDRAYGEGSRDGSWLLMH